MKTGKTTFMYLQKFKIITLIAAILTIAAQIAAQANTNPWERVNLPESKIHVYAVKFNPKNPREIFVASRPPGFMVGYGVFKSSDGGATWQVINEGISEKIVNDIAISGEKNGFAVYGSETKGVFLTTDGGKTWRQSVEGLSRNAMSVENFAFVPKVKHSVWAGTADGLYRLDVANNKWMRVGENLPGKAILAMATTPKKPNSIFIGLSTGIFKSDNDGKNWTDISKGLPEGNDPIIKSLSARRVQSLVIHPKKAETMFAGTLDGIFKTTNGGASWERIGTFRMVYSIAVNPKNPDTMYIGSFVERGKNGVGIFKTIDGGKSWLPYGLGVGEEIILDIAINPANPREVLAASRTGLFRMMEKK